MAIKPVIRQGFQPAARLDDAFENRDQNEFRFRAQARRETQALRDRLEAHDALLEELSERTVAAFWQSPSNYTLTSTTAVQKLFNVRTNGAVTLKRGRYEFACQFRLSSMSATSGNAAFSLGGTAVLDRIARINMAAEEGFNVVTALSGLYTTSAAPVTELALPAVNTSLWTRIEGIFRINTGSSGTVIPSIALTTAAAAVVQGGSFFLARRVSDHNVSEIGAWS